MWLHMRTTKLPDPAIGAFSKRRIGYVASLWRGFERGGDWTAVDVRRKPMFGSSQQNLIGVAVGWHRDMLSD